MKKRKVFYKSSLPMTFYAHTMQFIERNSYDKRCAVIFEAVAKDKIQMFVTGEFPEKLSSAMYETESFSGLWNQFRDGGLANEKFVADKAYYLGNVGNAEINLMFHSFAKAKAVFEAENDWWEITVGNGSVSEKEDACALQLSGYEWMEEEFPFEIRTVSQEESKSLYHLYTYYHEPKPQNQAEGSLCAIGPNTVYGSVEVLYVGAALCCRLVDVGNNVVGYFDMGIESSYSKKQLRKQNPGNYMSMVAAATHSYQTVQNDARNIPALSVIISHWHTDHVQILHDMAQDYVNNGNFANFWQTAEFLYPSVIQAKGWACTYFTIFRSAMQTAGNTNVTVAPYLNNGQNVNLYQSQNLLIYKCDRNDSTIRNPNHHDHGVWAKVRLSSGNTVFLAGDCAYDTIAVGNVNNAALTNGGQGYKYLVASHHGGRYTHTLAQNKAQYIPQQQQQSEVFYSANGAAYGHPVPANVNAYGARGWTHRYTQNLPGQNFNMFNLI